MLKVYQRNIHTINEEDNEIRSLQWWNQRELKALRDLAQGKSVSALSTDGEWRLSVIFIGRVKTRVLQAKNAFRSQSRSNAY